MPPQSAKPQDELPPGFKVATNESHPTTQESDPLSDAALAKDDKIDVGAFKDKWNTLTRARQEDFEKGLSSSEQGQFYEMLRGGKQSNASASPGFGPQTIVNVMSGNAENDPWVRQKVANLTNRVLNYLPAVGGTLGGAGGGIAGEAAWPAGGGLAGGVAGAAAGGAAGEAARQGSLHALGWDKNDPPMTPGQRGKEIGYAAIENAVAELLGRGAGKVMRPTVERAVKKLYFAGGLEHGDPMERGDLESIFPDLAALEKTNPVKDNKSLVQLLGTARREIGQKVDALYIPLMNTPAVTAPLEQSVQNLITKYSINPDINRTTIEMLKKVKLLAGAPRTYTQLADWRIQINNELRGFYAKHAGANQQALLMSRPRLLAMKEIADAIRDVSYPEMDRQAHLPPGTTALWQKKRGAAIALEKQALAHRERSLNITKPTGGAAPLKRGNMSGYVTSKGKIGAGIHRVTSILHAPDVLKDADKRAASAFGNTLPAKAGKVLSTRPGMAGTMVLPRMAVTPKAGPDPDVTQEQPAVIERLKQNERDGRVVPEPRSVKPALAAPKAYKHDYVMSDGRKIGSDDGQVWFYKDTGEQVQ